MNLSFPAWRRGEVRICGGLIDEALTRKHTVSLIWRPESKPGEAVNPTELQDRWPNALVFRRGYLSGKSLVPLAAVRDDDATVSLDYCLNHLHAPPPTKVRMMTFYSEWEKQQWLRLAREHWKRPSPYPDLVVTGDPALDGLKLCHVKATRRRYDLGDKPVVLVFALKFNLPGNHWRRWVYKYLGYRQTLRALRGFCDRLGASLVIKTRLKHQDPGFVDYYADKVVLDTDLYPSAAHQLLSVASLAVHWQSGAVYECAAAGVSQVSIRIPHPHLDAYAGSRLLFGLHVPDNSPQRWAGAVTSVAWSEAPRYFERRQSVWPPPSMCLEAYREKFLGPVDGKASARVLDAVEAM